MKEMILVHSINQCQFHAHCIGLQVHNNSENSLQAEPCIRPTDTESISQTVQVQIYEILESSLSKTDVASCSQRILLLPA